MGYETTDFNLKFLEKYTKDLKNGIYIHPSPTGSGKTHSVVQYALNHNKIIYSAPTNDVIDDMDEMFHEALRESEYKKRVFRLKNAETEMREWYDKFKDKNTIFDDKDSPFYKSYLALKNSTRVFENTNDSEDMLRKRSSFIYSVRKVYFRLLRDEDYEQAEPIKADMLEIFPSFGVLDYDIILLTTSKLYYQIHTLEKTDYLWNFKEFKQATVFLDEFDSQKNYVLDIIIKNTIRNEFDIAELFEVMVNKFISSDLSKYYAHPDEFNSLREYFIKFYNDKYLKFRFDSLLFKDNILKLPILMDSNQSIITTENLKNYSVTLDKKRGVLDIGENFKDKDYDILELLRGFKIAINRYIGLARRDVDTRLANEHSNLTKEINEATFIDDMVKIFPVERYGRSYNFLYNSIKNRARFSAKELRSDKNRWDFYYDGFMYFELKKEYIDSKRVEFQHFSLTSSPEAMLLDIAKKCVVVGLSATSTINSVISNYDLSFLKSQTTVIMPTPSEMREMERLYIETKRQKDREFETIFVKNSTELDEYKEIFGEFAEKFSTYKFIKVPKNNQIWIKNIYLNFCKAYRAFLDSDDIKSFLYFSPRSLNSKTWKDDIEHALLKESLIAICKASSSPLARDILKQIKNRSSDDFAHTKEIFLFEYVKDNVGEKYKEYIKNRDKFFIVTNYSTAGIGKNLNFYQDGINKDFDAIFLEKPTNIIQRYNNTDEDKLKGIWQIESLTRKCIISTKEQKVMINTLLSSKMGGIYSKTNDYIEATMKIIIQAMGRVHRTDSNHKMYIFIDDELSSIISSFDNPTIPLLPSLLEIKKRCEENQIPKIIPNDNYLENYLVESNHQENRTINYMLKILRESNNENDIARVINRWQEYREILLTCPTAINLDNPSLNSKNRLYIDIKKDSYTIYKKGDFDDVSFERKNGYKKMEISSKDAGLDYIKNNPKLYEYALKNSVATEFQSGGYHMIPIVYQNIYKGAIGEFFGRFLVEDYCGIKLENLSGKDREKYETFDYKYQNIYIDFKNLSQRSLGYEREDMVKNALFKLEKTDFTKAIIINLFGKPVNDKSYQILDGNVIIVPFLVDVTNELSPAIDIKMLEVVRSII